MDILICKIKYPNDTKNKIIPHQHFVGSYKNDILELYSISSIVGKEYKVYIYDGIPNPNYYLIVGNEQHLCALRAPSFIDCGKSYQIRVTSSIDINKLSHRDIQKEIMTNIKGKIQEVKDSGNHTRYIISSDDFLSYNAICRK